MSFALKELSNIYPPEEIKAIIYLLFEAYLGVGRAQYLLNPERGMSESDLLKMNFIIKKLKLGKPVQYLIGHTWFLGLRLLVNEHTLIPRPETEELVQLIISKEKEQPPLKILDIGTGTACIPIGLAHSMPQHEYFGIDFKKEIIDLAQSNIDRNLSNIKLIQLDILKDNTDHLPQFDVIISNPPYVLESEKELMHENVVKYEPASALYVPNQSPLVFYERIMIFSQTHLKKGGKLYFEINENHGDTLTDSLSKMKFKNIQLIRDFRDRNRFVFCEK